MFVEGTRGRYRKGPLTILACFILHNICLLRGDALENDEWDDDDGDSGSAPLPLDLTLMHKVDLFAKPWPTF